MHVPRITRMQRQVTQPGAPRCIRVYEHHLVRRLTHACAHAATAIFAFARGARAGTYIYLWASFTANFDRRSLPRLSTTRAIPVHCATAKDECWPTTPCRMESFNKDSGPFPAFFFREGVRSAVDSTETEAWLTFEQD